MHIVTDKEFDDMIASAMDELPKQMARVENMAILVEDQPSPEQRTQLHMHDGTLLFGLYEGVPLPQRGGANKLFPDKITLFKEPLQLVSHSSAELHKNIKHTLWHELAHYYGLDHKRIYELE